MDEWIKFETEINEDGEYCLCGDIPNENQEVLVTDGSNIWKDVFTYNACDGYCFDSGYSIKTKITHWTPLPKLPKKYDIQCANWVNNGDGKFKCSHCTRSLLVDKSCNKIYLHNYKHNYCPDFGAKMSNSKRD